MAMTGTRRWLTASTALLLTVTTACSSDGDTSEASPHGGGQRINWAECVGRSEVECATLSVPVDHSDPSGGTLDLALIRTPATGDRLGSLVLNTGGPGNALVDSRYFPVVSPTVQEHYDVVGFDPRGTGRSRRLECLDGAERADYDELDATPDSPAEVAALLEANAAYAAACRRADADLLPFLGSRDVVEDLDSLREALGEQKLNYLGFSYGTLLGARYAAKHPEAVGRIALDSLVPDEPTPLTGWVHDRAVNLEAALDRSIEYCLDTASCALGEDVPGARARLAAFLDGVDADPVDTGGNGVLTREVALRALDSSLGSGYDGYGRLDRALAAAYEGLPTQLLGLAERDPDFSPDDFRTVTCLDGGGTDAGGADPSALAAEWSADAPVFGAAYAWLAATWCTGWPDSTLGPATGPTTGTGPILLVSSALDPYTPPADARRMAAALPEATLLTYAGSEHLAYVWSPCVREAVDAYLVAGTIPADPTCPDRAGG
jgi:pimeloyl-ACP methyl ester carboxylesterase